MSQTLWQLALLTALCAPAAAFDDFYYDDGGDWYDDGYDYDYGGYQNGRYYKQAPYTPGVQNNNNNWGSPWSTGNQNSGFNWGYNNNWQQPQYQQNWQYSQPQYSQSYRPAQPYTPPVVYSNLPIKISMPAGEAGLCAYVLSGGNGSWNYTIAPGKSQTFTEDRTWKVTYDRGNGYGEQSYVLKPGHYRFRQSSRGWELYRSDSMDDAPLAQAPPPPM